MSAIGVFGDTSVVLGPTDSRVGTVFYGIFIPILLTTLFDGAVMLGLVKIALWVI